MTRDSLPDAVASSRHVLAPGGPSRSAWLASLRQHGLRDALAGFVAAIVLVGQIVSFGALMFSGPLNAGTAVAIWAMLIGGGVGGAYIALATKLPPMASAIDSPTGAVLVIMSTALGPGVLASGGTPGQAIATVMLAFVATGLLAGSLLYGLGAARLGRYLRFIPSFVVGGFLAATGAFLLAGGVRMTTGKAATLEALAAPWTWTQVVNLAAACAVLGVLLIIRSRIRWPYAMPLALVAMWGGGAAALAALGLSGPEHGFYLPSIGALTPWSPFTAVGHVHVTAAMVASLAPQLLTATIIAFISLVTKVSGVEVARQVPADLDCELRAHGVAALAAAPLGGLLPSLQVGTSRLMEQAGGSTRNCGVFCAAILAGVGLFGFNLPGLIPLPIIAGLVFSPAYAFIVDALKRPLLQRAWIELALVLFMMVVCYRAGFLTGVSVGLVIACIFFAVSYARRGVVRRHATRASFASNVNRSAGQDRFLVENGAAIQLYWLTGFVFFGSSELLFERVRRDIEAGPKGTIRYVVLDFGTVTGTDSSAIVSFIKLRDYCAKLDVAILYCSASPHIEAALARSGLIRPGQRQDCFADLSQGLSFCEDRMISRSSQVDAEAALGFEPWLREALGGIDVGEFLAFLDRKDVAGSQVIYHQGEAADTIDLVAAGTLVVEVVKPNGAPLRISRIATFSVVGEMGFLRRVTRSATVSSDGPATLFTMTRASFERMRRDAPGLAAAFDDFLLRRLADRVAFANATVGALLA